MKTIRHPKSRNKIWISAWILAAVLLVAVVIKYGVFAVEVPFMRIGAGVQNAGASIAGIFVSKNAVETENSQLKDQLAEVQVDIDRDKLLTQENLDLKQMLGRNSSNSSILATVLSKPPISLYDTVVVDVGANDHVTTGDTVTALGYVPVGVVSAVSAHTSVVALYSSSGQKIQVQIGKDISASAEAQGGGNFLIKLPKESAVVEGDPISAPGISTEVFGHVENIDTTENDPFIYVRFGLPVNMSELHFLQIDRSTVS